MSQGEELGEDAKWAAAGPGGQGQWAEAPADRQGWQCGQGERTSELDGGGGQQAGSLRLLTLEPQRDNRPNSADLRFRNPISSAAH